jgi:hypothetical protein
MGAVEIPGEGGVRKKGLAKQVREGLEMWDRR